MEPIWRLLAQVADPKPAAVIIAVAVVLGLFGWWKGKQVADRRPAPGRARAARRLALQPRHRDGDLEVLDRRRHPDRDRRDQAGGLRRLRRDDHGRRVLVAHGQHRGRAVDHRPRRRRQDAERRLERGQPEVARAGAQPVRADAVGDLRTDLHRAAQLRLQRDAGHDVHHRPQGRDDRAHRRRGEAPRGRARQPGRLVQAGDRQRRRHGGDQRGGVGGAVPDAGLGLRRGGPALPADLPLAARHALRADPAGARLAARLRPDGAARDRPQGRHAAGGGARRRHRRRLRHLHLQPLPVALAAGARRCARPTSRRSTSPATACCSPA